MTGEPARVRGTVINVHALGATVRLADGRLVAAPIADVNANRAVYARAVQSRAHALPFDLAGRVVTLAVAKAEPATGESAPPEPARPVIEPDGGDVPRPPAVTVLGGDERFEERMDAYLRSTQEWAPADRPQPFERHLFRKTQRAKLFRGGTNASGE